MHDKKAYWKKRIQTRLISIFKQLYSDLQEIQKWSEQTGVEQKEADRRTDKLILAFKKLDSLYKEE